jgi:release factor glutamine methyltransferase
MTHEPLAYIRGKQEFYGRDFEVSPDTLTPRPETETLIEMLFEIKPEKIIDIGTGSGCIAITAKLGLPTSAVSASDISKKCLQVAKKNAKNLHAEVNFFKSDLLQDLSVADISGAVICCNLPYVPNNFSINTAASHEPKLAIYGGEDGLDYYRQLFEEIISLPVLKRPVAVLTESLPLQHESISAIAEVAGFKLADTRDFIQYFVKA